MVVRVRGRRTLGRSPRRFIKPSRGKLPSNDRDRYPRVQRTPENCVGWIAESYDPYGARLAPAERVHQTPEYRRRHRESDLGRPRRRAYRASFTSCTVDDAGSLGGEENEPNATVYLALRRSRAR
jgi:hypothetical protein